MTFGGPKFKYTLSEKTKEKLKQYKKKLLISDIFSIQKRRKRIMTKENNEKKKN